MKYALILLALHVPSNGALIWSESFESYDLSIDNLEGQNPAWLTDPQATDAIAVISTASLGVPISYGAKSLALGGIAPSGEANDGVSYLLPPTVAQFTPQAELTEAAFSVDLIFSSAGLTSITDSFRLSFYDQNNQDLASLLFVPSDQEGFVSVYRSNTSNVFDSQISISADTAVTLNLVMNFELNKWTGTITTFGTESLLTMFSNVDMTAGNGEANLGGFELAWLREDTVNWGDNFLVMDNFSLGSQVPIPEPSSLLLFSGVALIGFFRRNR